MVLLLLGEYDLQRTKINNNYFTLSMIINFYTDLKLSFFVLLKIKINKKKNQKRKKSGMHDFILCLFTVSDSFFSSSVNEYWKNVIMTCCVLHFFFFTYAHIFSWHSEIFIFLETEKCLFFAKWTFFFSIYFFINVSFVIRFNLECILTPPLLSTRDRNI